MWPRFISIALGLWMMSASAVLGYGGRARTIDVILGALTASIAVIATTEVMRPLRWLNLALGVGMIVAPWVMSYEWMALANSTLVGLVVVAAAAIRGAITTEFGGGWSAAWPRRR